MRASRPRGQTEGGSLVAERLGNDDGDFDERIGRANSGVILYNPDRSCAVVMIVPFAHDGAEQCMADASGSMDPYSLGWRRMQNLHSARS